MVCLWLVPLASGFSQTMPEIVGLGEPSGAPPETGVRDDAGMFHRQPSVLARITETVQQLRDEHDFHLYLVIESVLVSGDVQSMAADLQKRWVPKGNGLVLVFERDTKQLGMGNHYEQVFGTDKPSGQVPTYVSVEIVSRAISGVNKDVPAEVFLEDLISRLAGGYNGYFQQEQVPVPGGRNLRLGLLIIGSVAGLGLVLLGAAWLVNRADRGGSRKCFFIPETEAVERLGAPYGGGEVSSRRFGRGAGG